MKLIGKIDDLPLFEVEDGKYIAVNPVKETCTPMWSWYAVLGKWADTFVKCTDDEEEVHCLKVIEQYKEAVVEKLNSYEEQIESDDGKEMLEAQREFYEWLDEGREYNYFDGYTDEEEE